MLKAHEKRGDEQGANLHMNHQLKVAGNPGRLTVGR
jgi:hypothetical protein